MRPQKLLFYFIKLFVLWTMMFIVQQVIFLFSANGTTIADIPGSILHALAMDISIFFYLMIIPFLLIIFSFFLRNDKIPLKILLIYFPAVIIISNLIFVTDLGLYPEWGTKISDKFFFYLSFPGEAVVSVLSMKSFWLILLALLISAVFIAVYVYLIHPERFEKNSLVFRITFSMIFLIAGFAGIRGGFQRIPIAQHWCYYSAKPACNQAAINSTWNFLDVLVHYGKKNTVKYDFYSEKDAERIFDSLMITQHDSLTKLFPLNSKPNIVLIMVESFSAEVTSTYGGQSGTTPVFDSLAKESLIFENFYASGFRTDQGLIAYLTGFPAQPHNTIIRDVGKFEKLPSLALALDSLGYSCSYFCGSNADFANTSAFLKSTGFEDVIEKDDFTLDKSTYWGAFDEDVFEYEAGSAEKTSAPFFHMIVTITSHEPFDAEVPKIFKEKGILNDYRNTIAYTDRCIGNYFKKAMKTSWYANTIFIITADHAHSLPGGCNMDDPQRFRIPLLITGQPLADELRGKRWEHYGSQNDLPATLLSQLGVSHEKFCWSKDILNGSADFAYFCFDDGIGWMTPHYGIIYDNHLKKLTWEKGDADDKNLVNGKAYLQKYMEDYEKF